MVFVMSFRPDKIGLQNDDTHLFYRVRSSVNSHHAPQTFFTSTYFSFSFGFFTTVVFTTATQSMTNAHLEGSLLEVWVREVEEIVRNEPRVHDCL